MLEVLLLALPYVICKLIQGRYIRLLIGCGIAMALGSYCVRIMVIDCKLY